MSSSFQFGAEGQSSFQVPWEDGESVFCRGWRGSLLDDLVLQAQNVQGPLRAVRLRNIGPFGRAGAIAVAVYPAVQVFQFLFEVFFLVRIPCHVVDARRGTY
jgi:hypothetical protein